MGRHPFSPEEVEAQRARVVCAAEALFAEHSYEGVTLRALANALGQSPTAAYRYFEDKAAIFTAARIAAYQRFAEAQEQASRESVDPVERLTRLGSAYVQFALDEPDAYRLMFELKQSAAACSAELRAAEERAWAPIHEATAAGVDAGLLQCDPDQLAHVFWAGLHGVVSLHLAGKLCHGLGLEDLHEPMKHLLFSGGAGPGRPD
jgi:AcrR family transcriptional regulator